jgi:hypothetical protein
MRIIHPLAIAALVLGFAGTAEASQKTTGEIQSVGPHSIRLFNGQTYELAKSVDRAALKPDWDYDITYDVAKGHRIATAVSERPQYPQGSTF